MWGLLTKTTTNEDGYACGCVAAWLCSGCLCSWDGVTHALQLACSLWSLTPCVLWARVVARSTSLTVLDSCGCTMTAVVTTPTSIITANLGDTRAVLCGPTGPATPLSTDHTLQNPAEAARVAALGALTKDGRLLARSKYVGAVWWWWWWWCVGVLVWAGVHVTNWLPLCAQARRDGSHSHAWGLRLQATRL